MRRENKHHLCYMLIRLVTSLLEAMLSSGNERLYVYCSTITYCAGFMFWCCCTEKKKNISGNLNEFILEQWMIWKILWKQNHKIYDVFITEMTVIIVIAVIVATSIVHSEGWKKSICKKSMITYIRTCDEAKCVETKLKTTSVRMNQNCKSRGL